VGNGEQLAPLIGEFAATDGTHATLFPSLRLTRLSQAGVELTHAVQGPALCVVAAGRKEVFLGRERYPYAAPHYLVFTSELPIAARVTAASPSQPYLGLQLDFSPPEIAGLLLQSVPVHGARGTSSRALYLGALDEEMLQPLCRLLRLLQQSADLPVLAPLVKQEILYRLLQRPEGARLAAACMAGSAATRVAKAIALLRTAPNRRIAVGDLANEANMQPAAFHRHFKALTSMTPLQFQKQLRLQEARRLLAQSTSAASAAYQVGYESLSQFSREYARAFGSSPAADAARLRAEATQRSPSTVAASEA
jgi:AraC-like DNA-binding protein